MTHLPSFFSTLATLWLEEVNTNLSASRSAALRWGANGNGQLGNYLTNPNTASDSVNEGVAANGDPNARTYPRSTAGNRKRIPW